MPSNSGKTNKVRKAIHPKISVIIITFLILIAVFGYVHLDNWMQGRNLGHIIKQLLEEWMQETTTSVTTSEEEINAIPDVTGDNTKQGHMQKNTGDFENGTERNF